MILYFTLLPFAVISFSFDQVGVKPETDKSGIQIIKVE